MKLREARDQVLSPYLLDHADNPVDWWVWGDQPFAEARDRDVPVLLSVTVGMLGAYAATAITASIAADGNLSSSVFRDSPGISRRAMP